MEAIKTILDIQASQLTLVSPRGGISGGAVFNLCGPPILQVAGKGTRSGAVASRRKVKYIHSSQVIVTAVWE